MFDTIHLNLHNLQKNVDVYNWIIRDGNNGVIKYDIDKKEVGGLLTRQVKIYPEADKATEVLRIHNRYEPSSHYSIIVEVHQKRDLIKFSFSIPKYFYGHNIAQAVQNTNERDFKFIRGYTDTLDYQIEQGFERLSTYIKSFFKTEFAGVTVDYKDIEIIRIDCCYNQIFNSKDDALFYLDMQKKIPKKYAHRDNQNITCYRTSIFYSSRDYSVKIYHKGSEYEKNDSKEHDRANKKYKLKHGIDLYDINYLQSIADKILRYEVTFRKDYLTYLFNTKIFRKKSKQFQQFKKLYDALHSLNEMSKKEAQNRLLHETNIKTVLKYDLMKFDTLESIYNDFNKQTITDRDTGEINSLCDYIAVYYKKKSIEKLKKTDIVSALNKFYDDFGNLLSKPRKIFFKLSKEEQVLFDVDNLTNRNFLQSVDYVPLTNELIKETCNFLKSFINDFKVNERDNLGTIIRNIHAHNNEVDIINKTKKSMLPLSKQSTFKTKKKIDVNRMSFVLIALEMHPLHDLRNILHLSDLAYYRLKKDLEIIGIDKNTLNKVVPIRVNTDFSDYFNECALNSKRMFINNASTRLFSPSDHKLLQLLNVA